MPTEMLIIYFLIFLTPFAALVYIILVLPFVELLMPIPEEFLVEQKQGDSR